MSDYCAPVTSIADGTHWVLTVTCPDRPGIVHAVSGACAAVGGNITESQQFSSPDTGRFFLRLQVLAAVTRERLEEALAPIADDLGATVHLDVVGRPMRTLVLGSRSEHCLQDLLFRQRSGWLPVEIPLVLSNHETLRPLAEFFEIPFEHHVVVPETKAAFEDRIRAIVAEHDIELVVLARYMQILSPRLCADLAGRVVNIHHSFLPGFVGAQPYRQAHRRGVKLIGATAHYVTEDLDEGPIIEQNVTRVDHRQSVADLIALGQDVESRTLTRAVKDVAEHRVLLDGTRTVVLGS